MMRGSDQQSLFSPRSGGHFIFLSLHQLLIKLSITVFTVEIHEALILTAALHSLSDCRFVFATGSYSLLFFILFIIYAKVQ